MATEQELFWQGEFGDQYIDRNRGSWMVPSNLALFSQALRRTHGVDSILEFGANIGMNLKALRTLLPDARLGAVEVNARAVAELQAQPQWQVFHDSILTFRAQERWSLVFSKTVLIHIAPADLPAVYQRMYDASSRYLLVMEYYNPTPMEVSYRGYDGKLFKRDFAGDLQDAYKDLHLLDYGFAYHRDPVFVQDDLTWFLLEKR
jgi:pseudaminic acid biosynthesis-associated methylase